MTWNPMRRLALPLCGLLLSGHVFAADGDKPLLQEGKKPYTSVFSQRLAANSGPPLVMTKASYSPPLAVCMCIKKKMRTVKAGSKWGPTAMAKPSAGCPGHVLSIGKCS